MPSRHDRAAPVTRRSVPLAAVPFVASLVSISNVQRALGAGGGGVTFPFPAGLPTLWTYVSLPGVSAGGIGTVTGPGALVAALPLFLVGLVVTSALEAGFLGVLDGRIGPGDASFAKSIERFTLRIVGVNLVRVAVVLAALPFLVFPPLAILVVLALGYLTYGLPFVVVTRDAGVLPALERTVGHATDGGAYATFGFAHLFAGAVASFFLSGLARNGGLPGILFGAAVVAVPAVFVAAYGVLVFRDLGGRNETASDRGVGPGSAVAS